MTDPTGDANVPPPATPDPSDPEYTTYEFTSTDWDPPPVPKDVDWFDREERTIRDAHAYAYQQFGTTYNWARYVNLGYFSYVNCTEFDKIWSKIEQDPLTVHRAIWYNFLYHVERDMPMTEQLNAWALNISHDYLEVHDVKFLNTDTIKYPKGVKTIPEINRTKEPHQQEWIQVTDKKKQPNRTQRPIEVTPAKTGGILRPPTQTTQTDHHQKQQTDQKSDKIETDRSNSAPRQSKLPTPSDLSGPTELEEDETMDVDETSNLNDETTPTGDKTQDTDAKVTAHPHIPTNDGTHRITVKWTPPTDITEFENDKHRLNEALFTLMTALFKDDDGVFYRWESEDLVETKAASSLTEVTARDFVSPKVTIMASRNIMVFWSPVRISVRSFEMATQSGNEETTQRPETCSIDLEF